MANQCAGTTRDGRPCSATVKPGAEYCPGHDPSRKEQRQRAASRAGRSRTNPAVSALKKRISEVVDGVLDGSVDRGRAAVAIQGLNALRGALELERRIRETDELEEQMRQIERRLEENENANESGGRRGR